MVLGLRGGGSFGRFRMFVGGGLSRVLVFSFAGLVLGELFFGGDFVLERVFITV